jgi:hypothetical protein
MATVAWTDARLNDAFEALRRDNAQLRDEMRALRAEMTAEIRSLREDMGRDMAAVRSDFHSDIRMLRVTLVACYVSFVAAFLLS